MSKEQKKEKVPNVLVIELVNQQPSGYIMDGAGSEDSDLPTNISAPNARKIKNRSKEVYIFKHPTDPNHPDNGLEMLRPIRYIKGCDLIYVDEQEKQGYQPSPVNDVIWVLNGKLTVIESGSDIGLYRFLKKHESNTTLERRPSGAVDIFCEISTIIDVLDMETLFDDEIKIQKYLGSLKQPMAGGEYQYNEDALSFLCSLFKLPPFGTGYQSEAWVAVAVHAKKAPNTFLQVIAEAQSLIETQVRNGLQKEIIAIDEQRAFFIKTQKMIVDFPADFSNDDKVTKLVEVFANPKNDDIYKTLKIGLYNSSQAKAGVVS